MEGPMDDKNSKSLQTEELEQLITNTASIESLQDQLTSIHKMKKLQYYVLELIALHKKIPQDIISQANFSKSYYYKILKGEKHPSRDIVLQLAFLIQASLEESNLLLKYAKYAPLYVKDPRDAILFHGIQHGLSLIEINHLLDEENHLLLD
jgi:hypothetical protein